MKLISIILGFLFFSPAIAEELAQVTSPELSAILANFQVLAKTEPDKSAISVQVIKVQDFGECDGTPKSCPQSTVYITASEYGEYPEQKVFKLPKKYNWEFIEWVKLTEYEGPNDYVELKMKAQRPKVNFTKSWWKDEYYLLKVNYSNGHWELQ